LKRFSSLAGPIGFYVIIFFQASYYSSILCLGVFPAVWQVCCNVSLGKQLRRGGMEDSFHEVLESGKVPVRKAVLVIEDGRSLRTSCRDVLEKEGYRVSVAANSREGMEKVSQEEYDAAIIDLSILGPGGADTLREMRLHKPDLKVIVITGYSSIHTAVEAIRAGASDYLPKAFEPGELLEKVKKVFVEKEEPSKPEVDEDDFLDEGSFPTEEESLEGARVLLANSDSKQRKTICDCLLSEPWETVTAKTREEVIDQVGGGSADILVLGVDAFGVKAYDMISEIRRIGSPIPVIVASADASLSLAQKLREVGIFFYLMEPFDPEEVRSAVRDAVKKAVTLRAERRSATGSPPLVRSVRTLAKDGTEVTLVTVRKGMNVNGRFCQALMKELKRRSLPMQIEFGWEGVSAKELPRYLEEEQRVVLIAASDSRGNGGIVSYTATSFEKSATREQRSDLHQVAYPEVLYWLKVRGLAPEVKIVCLPGNRLEAKEAREAASLIISEGEN
jgi:DNA-binding response OmpR family regulator/Ni,Fe-hydrogenase maturation factor